MDTKHRHELEQNDLQEFVSHFGGFWSRHGTKILVVVLLIVVIVLGRRIMNQRAEGRHETVWSELELATSDESLRQVAVQFRGNATIEALAYLRGADLALGKAQTYMAGPETAERTQGMAIAEGMYQDVLNNRAANPLFHHNARLGLGTIAEERGEWDRAGELYRQVSQEATAYPHIRAKADARLGMLSRLSKPIIYSPDRTRITGDVGLEDEATPAPTPDAPVGPPAPEMIGPEPTVRDAAPTPESAPAAPAP